MKQFPCLKLCTGKFKKNVIFFFQFSIWSNPQFGPIFYSVQLFDFFNCVQFSVLSNVFSRGKLKLSILFYQFFSFFFRHHFKNILYCGEPDDVVDKYMEHYNGQSGTYFSFLPVFHMQSAGYECLLGAIEMGYRVDGFLLVNENTLVNSWNFGNDLDLSTVWHGNEHATNVTSANLNELDTEPDEIMKSMLGILQAFQFLENVLFADALGEASKTSSNSQVLVPPPLVTNEGNHHSRRRREGN